MASLSHPLQLLAAELSASSLNGKSVPSELVGQVECPDSVKAISPTEIDKALPYEIVNIEGKGEGVIATRDLVPGDFIASEKAQLKWHCTEESYYRLEWMLSKLPDDDREKFYRLHNCYTEEEMGCSPELLPPDIIGKWRTNGFGIDNEHQIILLGVITKLNHACRENVTRHYCSETDTMTVVACDYIKRGQELVHSYMDVLQDCNHRRLNAMLAWGFLCACEVCTLPPDEQKLSDERRVRIAEIRDLEQQKKDQPEIRMQLLKEALHLCIAEGLYGVLHIISIQCVKLCAELNLEQEVSAWASIAVDHLIMARGRDDREVQFMKRCVGQPWLWKQDILKQESWSQRAHRLTTAVFDNLFRYIVMPTNIDRKME